MQKPPDLPKYLSIEKGEPENYSVIEIINDVGAVYISKLDENKIDIFI